MSFQPTSPGHNQQSFTNPGRVGAPRLDAYQRLLGRFYETLFFLEVLGQTRGHHTTVPPDFNLEQAHRREFLRNLAYICDFEKGGSSCTAIGLEDSDACYKFWVASNTVSGKIVDFLKGALSILQRVACHPSSDLESDKAAFARFCINFAASRVKKETKCLFRAVRECRRKLGDPNTEAAQQLKIWMDLILEHDEDDHFTMCEFAYNNRQSKFIHSLMAQAKEEEEKTGPQSKWTSFALARHCLGRLAHHIRAPQQLVKNVGHLSNLLEAYDVCAIKPIRCVPQPVLDSHSTLQGILNRMLKKDDPERPKIESILLNMDTQSGIFGGFLARYERCTPQVHSEVQVLEHFYKMKLSFVRNDRYIACSKPACLCCELYFKHHPARMVVPESHRKVWLNWGPPLVQRFNKNDPESVRQRDTINRITQEIRSNVIAQIFGHSSAVRWHPDSRTGITENWHSSSRSSEPSDTELWDVKAGAEQQITTDNALFACNTLNRPEEVDDPDEDSDSDNGGVSIYI